MHWLKNEWKCCNVCAVRCRMFQSQECMNKEFFTLILSSENLGTESNQRVDHFRERFDAELSIPLFLWSWKSPDTIWWLVPLFHIFLSFHYFNYASQISFHGSVLKSCTGHDGLFCLAKFSRTWFIVCRWFMVRKLILNSASDCGWLKSRSPCRLFTSTLCQLKYFYNKKGRK